MLEHFEVVCCFVFRHFSRLIPAEPCRDMSKYIVLLCLRHNCIMIRIAPISSPWTTRSAQNQAAWNVSQTVKPCQTMSDPLNCVKLKKTCHESEGNPEESHSEPMESLLIALWIRYFVYDSEVQLLCLVDSQVHLWESLVVRCCLYTWLQDHAIKFVSNCYFLVRCANLARGRKFRVEKPDPCHPRPSTSYRPTELEVWNTTEWSFILLNSCNSLREFSTCKCKLELHLFASVRAGATRRNLSDSALCSCVIHQRLADYDPSVASLKWCRWPSLAAGMGFQTFLSRIVKKNTEERSSQAWRNIQCSIRSPPRSSK